jgi:HEAT repeat protein
MSRFLAFAALLASIAVGLAWHSQFGFTLPFWSTPKPSVQQDDQCLKDLYSQNPREAQAATGRVAELGERAIPVIRATLRDPNADREKKKGALKACSLLEQRAAPVIPEVAAHLSGHEFTEEAAVALSFMGPAAFGPLRQAVSSPDPLVRQEALRSIGKLNARAGLNAKAVVPMLLTGLKDDHRGVRVVAATYLGILHDNAPASVPALIEALDDPDIQVRRASAEALGAFGPAANEAIPALRKAAAGEDPDLAREAGLSLIKLQPPKR